MKLLFDQNISHRVVFRIGVDFPEARHVRDFNLQFTTDLEIWRFAKENDFTLVTFDSDFNDILTLNGHPPKIIWLRIGNTLTQHLVERLLRYKDVIQVFLTDTMYSNVGCLEISN